MLCLLRTTTKAFHPSPTPKPPPGTASQPVPKNAYPPSSENTSRDGSYGMIDKANTRICRDRLLRWALLSTVRSILAIHLAFHATLEIPSDGFLEQENSCRYSW